MPASETGARAAVYAQRLIDSRYAQENVGEAVESLRQAYQRASKRRVEPTRDEKVRKQVRQAADSIKEAIRVVTSGREKPKKRWGRRLLVLVGVGLAGIAAVVAVRADRRDRIAA